MISEPNRHVINKVLPLVNSLSLSLSLSPLASVSHSPPLPVLLCVSHTPQRERRRQHQGSSADTRWSFILLSQSARASGLHQSTSLTDLTPSASLFHNRTFTIDIVVVSSMRESFHPKSEILIITRRNTSSHIFQKEISGRRRTFS